MKKLFLLLSLISTTSVFALPVGPGGQSSKDQCFPWVYASFFYSTDSLTSYAKAIENQNICRASR